MNLNRTEKLKTLQDTLQGKTSQLQQLHQQRRKDAMPCKNATGFLSANSCPAELLGLIVADGEALIDDDTRPLYSPLVEWLLLPSCTHFGAATTALLAIDAHSDQLDTLPLAGMMLELRGYTRRYLYGGTIGDLRRIYNQSAASVERSGILLFISYDVSRFSPTKLAPAK